MEKIAKKLELDLNEFSSQTKILILNETNDINILLTLIDDNDTAVRYAVIRKISFLKLSFSDERHAEKMANLLYKLLKAENEFKDLYDISVIITNTLADIAELCIKALFENEEIYSLDIPIEFCLILIAQNCFTSIATLNSILDSNIKFKYYRIEEIILNRLRRTN